jgi:hypothetical protein
MKPIAIVGAGGIGRGGNSDAFIGDRAVTGRLGKLSHDPSIGQVVVKDNRIAVATSLTGAAETGPDGRDTIRSQDGVAGCFIEYLVAFVNDLDVLGFSNCAVVIGRRTIATDAGEGDTVEVI